MPVTFDLPHYFIAIFRIDDFKLTGKCAHITE